MAKLPKKFTDRASSKLKNYQSIVSSIKDRDAHESDTVTVVKDILADIFGYDKFRELTSEQQIKGTFCDLAIKIDDKVRFLIEVKSADSNLNDTHLRQAINYGIHHNIEWVGLTNSVEWRFYKIRFEQPIGYDEVVKFDFTKLSAKSEADLQLLYLIAREGLSANAIQDFHQKSLILNKFTVAEIMRSESVINATRKEFKKLFPDIKIDNDDVLDLIYNEIFKREVIEGDKVKEAQSRIKKALSKLLRSEKKEIKQDNIALSQDNTIIDVA